MAVMDARATCLKQLSSSVETVAMAVMDARASCLETGVNCDVQRVLCGTVAGLPRDTPALAISGRASPQQDSQRGGVRSPHQMEQLAVEPQSASESTPLPSIIEPDSR